MGPVFSHILLYLIKCMSCPSSCILRIKNMYLMSLSGSCYVTYSSAHTHTHTHKITCLLSASSIMRPPGLIKREHRSSLGKKLIVNLCSMGAYHFYCSGYQAAFTTQITLRIVFIQKKQSFIWYKEMKLQQILNLWAVAFWWLWRLVLLQHLYTYAEVCFSRGRIHQILKRM